MGEGLSACTPYACGVTDDVSATEIVARRLREIRARRRLSAQDVADRCSALGLFLNRQTLSNLENHRRDHVSVDELLVLARVLEVSPVALLQPIEGEERLAVGTVVLGHHEVRSWFF